MLFKHQVFIWIWIFHHFNQCLLCKDEITQRLTNKLKLGQRCCVSVSFHLPTLVIRRSGWSCRNMNWLQSEVISHSTSSRLITVSASCRTYRGLQQTGVGHMEDVVWVLVREGTYKSEKGKLKVEQSSPNSTQFTRIWLTFCTSSLETEPVASVSTAPQPFWKVLARKRATLGGTPHSSESSSLSWAKSSSNRVTLEKNMHTHLYDTSVAPSCSFITYLYSL